jgi:hypothetical protein
MHQRCASLALLIVASPFSAFAAELPKEGSYDYTSCWSGVNNVITFSKCLSEEFLNHMNHL